SPCYFISYSHALATLVLSPLSLHDALPISAFVVYLPDVVLICERNAVGRWAAERVPNPVGRALMVPIPYDPQINTPFGRSRISRSEEHTSELQSRFDLVCRLLLEKKKMIQ